MDAVHRYHENSKHQPERYAPGPGGLDWASQPDPFRRYEGAPLVELPLLASEPAGSWDSLLAPARPPPCPLGVAHLAAVLQLSFGLSAWKSYGGQRWALRCNPSSGNLHPTEASLIVPALPGLAAGVYHYRPDRHGLEQRAAAPFAWEGGVFVALSGIDWREAWKYGLRAFRYDQLDGGHALAAVSYAAALYGWPVRQLGEWREEGGDERDHERGAEWGDDQIAALCGLDRPADFVDDEAERPEALLWIGAGAPPPAAAVFAALAGATWAGRANRLSPTHRVWPGLAEIHAATRRPAGTVDARRGRGAPASASSASQTSAGPFPVRSAPAEGAVPGGRPAGPDEPSPASPPVNSDLPPLAPACALPAARLIVQRRSAQAFDAVTGIAAPRFFRLLDALLPRPALPPWSLHAAVPAVHPIVFVHRVDGLPAGLYVLPRVASALAALRRAMRVDWLWERVAAAPAHLPLYLLAPLDVRDFAAAASCQQDIAADSAFALAMLARFDDIDAAHPWRYRQRFCEAGVLGQVLYLEAEAAGLRGTGIGCFFDDVVHRALGVDTAYFQDVYHFTVGGALTDQRLGDEAGYAHLERRNPSEAPGFRGNR